MSSNNSNRSSPSPRPTVSCRRDLQIAPRPCADPAVCGVYCLNVHAAEWKAFGSDRASQSAAQRRRLERGQMIQHVLHVLRAQFRVCLVTKEADRVTLQETVSVRLHVHVAKHLELLMYRAALSKSEYCALATVSRRVQHFAVLMNDNAKWKVKILPRLPSGQSSSNSGALATAEQRRKVWLFTPAWWGTRDGRKRRPQHGVLVNGTDRCTRSLVPLPRSLALIKSSSVAPTPSTTASASSSRLRLLFDGVETSALVHVFSFLSGSDVVRGFAINCLCLRELPRAITDLRVSSSALSALLSQLQAQSQQTPRRAVLLPNLEHLCIRPDTRHVLSASPSPSQRSNSGLPSVSTPLGKRRRSKSPPTPPQPGATCSSTLCAVPHSVMASACPLQSLPARVSGELAVLAIARLLQHRDAPKLRTLCLCATFANSVARNGVFALTEALASPGACPMLERLWLGGNALGDYGAMCVAKALSSGSIPRLACLDLRANAIGHDGMQALASALTQLGGRCTLQQLCLGGNLLTPDCVVELMRGLDSGALRRLAFLGLDGNFLTPASVAPVARALVRGACPRLRELSVGGNAELFGVAIAAVFKAAADADDGESWGLFRPSTEAAESSKRRRMS